MDLNVNFFLLLAIDIYACCAACVYSKYSMVANHTGCIERSPSARHLGDMTSELKDDIVHTHNRLRATVNATNMQRMVWDEELAMLSQKWADNCEFKHDSGKRAIPGRYTVGQNLGMGHQNWQDVLNSWWSEIRDFRYSQQTEMIFSRVGHFTQMAWAETAKVGCGWAVCTNPQMAQFSGGRYFVCNYASAGNRQWWIPYNVTNSLGDRSRCSSCPNTCNRDGLCDCAGKVCQNGGTLNIDTCECQCTKPFHTPDVCGLDCERATDSRHCGSFWRLHHCQQYINVPHECPHMCELCPLADYRLQYGNTTTSPSTPSSTRQMVTTTQATTLRPSPEGSVNITSGVTDAAFNVTTPAVEKNTTGKSIDIKIEEKDGKTVISIPNKKMPSSNEAVRVVERPASGLYSTLVLILQLI